MKRILSIMLACCTLGVSAQNINIIPAPFEVKQAQTGTYAFKKKITWSSNFPKSKESDAVFNLSLIHISEPTRPY